MKEVGQVKELHVMVYGLDSVRTCQRIAGSRQRKQNELAMQSTALG